MVVGNGLKIVQKPSNTSRMFWYLPTFVTHYDPSLPLRLAADTSAYGLGAVISHVMEDGQEQPIAFASHTLSISEQNYSQIEKEALALIFGV